MNLSQHEARYREYLARRSKSDRACFDEAIKAVRGDLLDAECHGADPALLLHVLVCTRFRTITLSTDRSEALRRLTRRQRGALAGALRVCVGLGEKAWTDVLVGAAGQTPERAYQTFAVLDSLYWTLVTSPGRIETPAAILLTSVKAGKRDAGRPVTAAIVCLMEEIKHSHKPAAIAAILLYKFGLIPRSDRASIEFVKKRVQRASPEARLDARFLLWSYGAPFETRPEPW